MKKTIALIAVLITLSAIVFPVENAKPVSSEQEIILIAGDEDLDPVFG